MALLNHEEVSRIRRGARDEILLRTSGTLSSAQGPVNTLNEYTLATASVIVENIRNRQWTALEVMKAYIRRALEAHEAVNCLTEGEC